MVVLYIFVKFFWNGVSKGVEVRFVEHVQLLKGLPSHSLVVYKQRVITTGNHTVFKRSSFLDYLFVEYPVGYSVSSETFIAFRT